MTDAAPPPPPESPVASDLEVAILRHLYDDEPTARAGAAAIAREVADDPDAISYLFGLYDDLCGLHDMAGSKLADASPPKLTALARIDMLLDDVMILLASRGTPPGGGQEVESRGRSAAVGKGQRSR